LVGCGGGSSTTPSSTTSSAASATGSVTSTASTGSTASTTPRSASADAAFIAGADAICRRTNERITALAVKRASLSEVERAVPRTIALEHEAVAQLERLQPPASLSTAWRLILADRRTLAAELDKLIADYTKHDTAALNALGASKRSAHTSLAKVASVSGFKDCAHVGPNSA
jgi:hypothetical protein